MKNSVFRISVLLFTALALMGAADGNLGWIEPFLSPALIITVGLAVWREARLSRKGDSEVKNQESRDRQVLVERLTSIEQVLLGYQDKGGLLEQLEIITSRSLDEAKRRHDMANHIQILQGAMEDMQIWCTVAGTRLKIPYERRNTR